MNMHWVLVGSRRCFSGTSDIDGEPSRLRFLHVIVLDEHNQEALGREQIDVDFRQQFDGGPCLPIVDNGEHRLAVGDESLDPVQDLENAAFATAPRSRLPFRRTSQSSPVFHRLAILLAFVRGLNMYALFVALEPCTEFAAMDIALIVLAIGNANRLFANHISDPNFGAWRKKPIERRLSYHREERQWSMSGMRIRDRRIPSKKSLT